MSGTGSAGPEGGVPAVWIPQPPQPELNDRAGRRSVFGGGGQFKDLDFLPCALFGVNDPTSEWSSRSTLAALMRVVGRGQGQLQRGQ